jgi:signal transduction histidine kinase
VDNVLDIHQFETGQVPLNQMSIPVAALFGDIQGQFAPMLAETNITLTADIAENLPPLWVDVNYMNRVLANLVDNAIKYTEDNGRIRLWASLDSNSDMMLMGVDDKGMGIPPSVQPRLFLKFHKDLGGKGRRKGSGLGLPFCKLVVEAHGGEMWVESSGEPGEGSRFVMRLPITA